MEDDFWRLFALKKVNSFGGFYHAKEEFNG
jgi:hypothetical protein